MWGRKKELVSGHHAFVSKHLLNKSEIFFYLYIGSVFFFLLQISTAMYGKVSTFYTAEKLSSFIQIS